MAKSSLSSLFAFFLFFLWPSLSLQGQEALVGSERRDTTGIVPPSSAGSTQGWGERRELIPFVELPPSTFFTVAGGGVALALVSHGQDWHLKRIRDTYLGEFHMHYDDYLFLLPLLSSWGFRGASLPSRSSGTWEMLSAQLISLAIQSSSTILLKNWIGRGRPDRSGYQSFPSGHTSLAFASAALFEAEYGRRYPLLSLLGYGTALVTGTSRILNDRHWLTDVISGATLGVSSVYLGYAINRLFFPRSSSRSSHSPLSLPSWQVSLFSGRQSLMNRLGGYQSSKMGFYSRFSAQKYFLDRWGYGVDLSLFSSSDATTVAQSFEGALGGIYRQPLPSLRSFLKAKLSTGVLSSPRAIPVALTSEEKGPDLGLAKSGPRIGEVRTSSSASPLTASLPTTAAWITSLEASLELHLQSHVTITSSLGGSLLPLPLEGWSRWGYFCGLGLSYRP